VDVSYRRIAEGKSDRHLIRGSFDVHDPQQILDRLKSTNSSRRDWDKGFVSGKVLETIGFENEIVFMTYKTKLKTQEHYTVLMAHKEFETLDSFAMMIVNVQHSSVSQECFTKEEYSYYCTNNSNTGHKPRFTLHCILQYEFKGAMSPLQIKEYVTKLNPSRLNKLKKVASKSPLPPRRRDFSSLPSLPLPEPLCTTEEYEDPHRTIIEPVPSRENFDRVEDDPSGEKQPGCKLGRSFSPERSPESSGESLVCSQNDVIEEVLEKRLDKRSHEKRPSVKATVKEPKNLKKASTFHTRKSRVQPSTLHCKGISRSNTDPTQESVKLQVSAPEERKCKRKTKCSAKSSRKTTEYLGRSPRTPRMKTKTGRKSNKWPVLETLDSYREEVPNIDNVKEDV